MSYDYTIQNTRLKNEERNYQKHASTNKKAVGKMMKRQAELRNVRSTLTTDVQGPNTNANYGLSAKQDLESSKPEQVGKTIFLPKNI